MLNALKDLSVALVSLSDAFTQQHPRDDASNKVFLKLSEHFVVNGATKKLGNARKKFKHENWLHHLATASRNTAPRCLHQSFY